MKSELLWCELQKSSILFLKSQKPNNRDFLVFYSNKENENEKIQKLNNQVESFREQLILSQALKIIMKIKFKINNIKKQNEENEKLKIGLKKNNLLLSNILKENNELT